MLGFLAKRLGQPPLLGFLAAGFVLELLGFRPDIALEELANVGVLLLLFTIGLKLDVSSVVRPVVWAVTVLDLLASVAVVTAAVLGLAAMAVGRTCAAGPRCSWRISRCRSSRCSSRTCWRG